MKTNFWKFLFLSFIAAIALSAFSVYAAKQAIHQDPELFAKIEKQFGIHINNFEIQFAEGGTDYMPMSSSWEYTTPTEKISIEVLSGDIDVISTEGDKVLVSAEGEMSSQAKQLIDATTETKKLVLKAPIKTVRNLHVTVSIPKSYTKKVEIISMSGDITLKGLEVDSVIASSASGDIQGENLLVPKFKAQSLSGDIKTAMRAAGNYELRSTSGDVSLAMPQSDDATIDVGSMSGQIHNTHRSNPNGKFKIHVGTTSGDVSVE